MNNPNPNLRNYLLGHEDDIASGANDFADLRTAFCEVIGRYARFELHPTEAPPLNPDPNVEYIYVEDKQRYYDG